jgi:hypothetical protein
LKLYEINFKERGRFGKRFKVLFYILCISLACVLNISHSKTVTKVISPRKHVQELKCQGELRFTITTELLDEDTMIMVKTEKVNHEKRRQIKS